MTTLDPIPMVRCRLEGPDRDGPASVRYVRLEEFGLWQYMMETRHGRWVGVEEVALWIPERVAWWNSGVAPETLEPVLRIRYERPGASGIPIPMERFFPAETYLQAQEALLSHFDPPVRVLSATPGYFVPSLRRSVRTA